MEQSAPTPPNPIEVYVAAQRRVIVAFLVLIGVALRDGRLAVVAKVGLVAALQFLTAPTGAHMVGRAVHRDTTEHDDDLDPVDGV